MQQAVLILDSNKEIYFDETVSINKNSYADFSDRDLIDFARDEIFDNKSIIELSNSDGNYIFPASKILCLKQYKEY